jgi:carbon storage regulator CsrA
MSLVLNRNVGQTIVIDGPCTITLAKVNGGRVSLALDGPRSTNIRRGELASDASNRLATEGATCEVAK